jgi:D-alanine-D-alanine ligase
MRNAVLVTYNRSSGRGEISEDSVLEEARDVALALSSKGFAVETLAVDSSDLPRLGLRLQQNGRRLAVFNLCEGLDGDSGKEPLYAAFLEDLGVPFTGNRHGAMRLCLDKGLCKSVLANAGVPTPAYRVFEALPDADAVADLPYPMIVKPAREDGSLGIDDDSVVGDADALLAAVGRILAAFGSAIAEAYLPGREFNIGVLETPDGPRALPAAELIYTYAPGKHPILTHRAKWITDAPEYGQSVPVCPAVVDDQLRDAMTQTAQAAFRALGCRHYARVDLRLDGAGNPMVIDINPNPDISASAGLARAVRASGRSYEDFVHTLVEQAWNGN